MMRRVAAGAVVAGLASFTAGNAFAIGDLVDHRALYNMSLAHSTPGSDIQGMSGQMVLEVKTTCGGTTVTQLLKTNTWGDDQQVQVGELTASSFESDDGKSFRFTMHNEVNGTVVEEFQGAASRRKRDSVGKITYGKKRFPAVILPAHAVFPSAYMLELLKAARASERTVTVTVFDGSDQDKIYRSTSIIGPKSKVERSSLPPLKGVEHWPVDLSYFQLDSDEPTPDYESSFDLYANGVSGNLVMDYGDFAMKGELASLEILPVPKCGKKG
jgi:hypothetical protein